MAASPQSTLLPSSDYSPVTTLPFELDVLESYGSIMGAPRSSRSNSFASSVDSASSGRSPRAPKWQGHLKVTFAISLGFLGVYLMLRSAEENWVENFTAWAKNNQLLVRECHT